MCLHKFGARDSWLNCWEHRGEEMYCPRALLKIPRSGTTFFFAIWTALPAWERPRPPSEALRRLSVPLRTCNEFLRPSLPFTKGSQQGQRQPDPSRTFPRPGCSSSWRTRPSPGMGPSSGLLQPSPGFASCESGMWRLSAWHTSRFRGLFSFRTPKLGTRGAPPGLYPCAWTKCESGPTEWLHEVDLSYHILGLRHGYKRARNGARNHHTTQLAHRHGPNGRLPLGG